MSLTNGMEEIMSRYGIFCISKIEPDFRADCENYSDWEFEDDLKGVQDGVEEVTESEEEWEGLLSETFGKGYSIRYTPDERIYAVVSAECAKALAEDVRKDIGMRVEAHIYKIHAFIKGCIDGHPPVSSVLAYDLQSKFSSSYVPYIKGEGDTAASIEDWALDNKDPGDLYITQLFKYYT